MATQSKTWQRNYLAKAKDTANLYWYPEARLKPKPGTLGDRYTPVGYPGAWIPLVPVGNNSDASRRIIDMLCALFRPFAPNALEIVPVLTDAQALKETKALAYDWTQDVMIDTVCICCGAIETVGHTLAEEDGQWLCTDCIQTKRWHELHKDDLCTK